MKLEVESYIEKKGDQDVDKIDLSNFNRIRCDNCGKLGHLKRIAEPQEEELITLPVDPIAVKENLVWTFRRKVRAKEKVNFKDIARPVGAGDTSLPSAHLRKEKEKENQTTLWKEKGKENRSRKARAKVRACMSLTLSVPTLGKVNKRRDKKTLLHGILTLRGIISRCGLNLCSGLNLPRGMSLGHGMDLLKRL